MTTPFEGQWQSTGPRILVRRDKTELQKMSSLLHIPEDVLKKDASASVTGTVLQVGEQAYNLPSQAARDGQQLPWVKPGDRVIIGQYAGSRILVEGAEDLVIINDEDVLMVMRE